MNTRPLVSVIDDDESVRESLPSLLARFGLEVRSFSSGDEFLSSDEVLQTNCLLLDITMPGMSGIEVFERLKRLGRDIPVIFITAHRDESVRSQVLEQGAIACLFKPFSGRALRSAIEDALKVGR